MCRYYSAPVIFNAWELEQQQIVKEDPNLAQNFHLFVDMNGFESLTPEDVFGIVTRTQPAMGVFG